MFYNPWQFQIRVCWIKLIDYIRVQSWVSSSDSSRLTIPMYITQDTKVISFQTHLATCQDQWVTSRHLWCRKVPCRSGQQSPWVSWLKNRNDDEKGQNIFDLQDILTKNEQSSQNGRNNEPQKARYWDHSSIIEDHDGVGLKAGFRESVVYNAHHVINRQRGIEQTQECE